MERKERYEAFINYFREHQPDPKTELFYETPFELLIAVILSAQCTDKRVNLVTPALFKAFPSPEVLAQTSVEEVFSFIRSISYPNNKAKYLVKMANTIMEDFCGQIPENAEDLQKLAGVGRKTAHVVASVLYNEAAMPVDTHVFRVSKRLGLVDEKATTPLAVEKQLVQYLPVEEIPRAHHWLILHGRYICLARKPLCAQCNLRPFCHYYTDK